MNRRRALLTLLTALVLVLIAAPAALAAAGGGSAGFGGGGGGAGGGGGGRGFALYLLLQFLIRIALIGHGLGALVLIGLVVLWVLFTRFAPGAQAFWSSQQSAGRVGGRRVAQRQRSVQLAAAEAAEDDPAFAPDVVRPAAARLFKDIQSAWDSGNRVRLRRLVAPELLREWERRLDDLARRGWRNRVAPLGEPAIEYVGLTHRGELASDRVVVRVEARMRDFVEDAYGNHIKRAGRFAETVFTREFWTLARTPAGNWILASVEQGAEGKHALADQIVATPWSDEQSMHDEALVEGAVAQAVPEGTKVSEVASLEFDGDARAAALDLSLADGRFSPDVLEVAARRAVTAWAEAIDGGDSSLRAIATPDAARELLYPGDPSGKTRLVVRGPRVEQIRVAALDPAAEPPTMTIAVEVEGCRYLEDRDTTEVIAGSKSRRTLFTERWIFALDGDPSQPWRVASVVAPVAQA
jgi:predicted lipid-binding transport protein (Tim44 family)